MKRYGMVIDLQNCVGCGACALACKSENNTRGAIDGQSFNWADFMIEETGAFPEVGFTVMPVLCNHCAKAPCVESCPTTPKAMYKAADGITMHNDDRCIGCRQCQEACPYSAVDIREENRQYSVISFHEKPAYDRYRDPSELIPNATASGAEITRRTEQLPPHRTMYRHPDYGSVRRMEVTEKCTFCAHRLADGLMPACVDACPADARFFGDLNDADSVVAKKIKSNKTMRLQEDKGTEPSIYYIRAYATEKK
ncbi:MAG: 4Fe-4S dicluster domain-containing protein [Planctomycetota bacterium]